MEFGSLWELCNAFTDLVTKNDLAVPTGSTILIGSASHLTNVGISASHAEELAAVSRKLAAFTEGGIYFLPCPFILCAESSDPELVRATNELVSWLGNMLSKEVCYTPVAMELSARRMLLSNFPVASSPTRRLLLPEALSSPMKKKWACGATTLPVGAARFDYRAEREIVEALVKELNSRLALNLEPDISFRRQVEAPAATPEKFIVIGASHANKTADALAATGAYVIKLVQPGWRVTKTRVAELAAQLKSVLAREGEECTLHSRLPDVGQQPLYCKD